MSVLDDTTEVRDGRLLVDGVDVAELAGRTATPFFLFSAQRLRWNVESIRGAFTRRHLDTEVFYACKACSLLWVLRQVHAAGIGVEVNSGGELWRALQAGFAPDQIVFNGIAKTVAEIREGLRLGIRCFLVDSLFELERIASVAASMGLPAPVALRVDVGVTTHTHPAMTTSAGGKAGIDLDDALDGYRFAAAHASLRPIGLHTHIGSQITSPAPYTRALETALDLVERIESECGLALEFVDIGGGLPRPYVDVDPGLVADPDDFFQAPHDVDEYAEALCAVLDRRRPSLTLFLEPGRAVVSDAAVLVSRVEAVKRKTLRDGAGERAGDEHYLILDAGYNTLPESYLVDWYYPAVVASRLDEGARSEFVLAGPLCDSGDVFPGDPGSHLRRLAAGTGPGDVVVFGGVGCYSIELMTPFMARPPAAAYAVEDGRVIEIRRRQSQEELVAGDLSWQASPR